jgi:large subunit ribosomal protein L3
MNTFIATKHQMSQTWDKNGRRFPVTILQAQALTVTQVKSPDSDGYHAFQVGLGTKSTKNITSPLRHHLKLTASTKKTVRHLKEIRSTDPVDVKVGDSIPVSDVLEVGDIVNVAGISKGRGFAGVVKRWGFSGGPRTHGQSDRLRAPGSIGQGTDPGRVHKGKKMAGRMGNQRYTIRNLQVLHIDPTTNQVWVSGPVPGATGCLISVTKVKSGKFTGLFHSPTPPAPAPAEPTPAESTPKEPATTKSKDSQTIQTDPAKQVSETKAPSEMEQS